MRAAAMETACNELRGIMGRLEEFNPQGVMSQSGNDTGMI